jgi:CheY-like chemotaxis protein/CHASE3 domain sensor protein
VNQEHTTAAPAAAERPDLHRARFLPVATFWIFVVELLAVVLIAAGSSLALQARSESSLRMRHTLDVLQHLELLLSALKDAETGQRGFLLSGDAVYLEPYTAAGATIAAEEARVRGLVADNPQQSAMLVGVERNIDLKLGELRRTVELQKSGDNAGALAMVQSGEGRHTMDVIRGAVEQMKEVEREQLAASNLEWQESAGWSMWVTIGGALVLLTLLSWSAYTMSQSYRERTAQIWMRSGQSGLALEVMGELQLEQVASKTLAFLARYLEAQVGALYTVEIDGSLKRRATYAFKAGEASAPSSFKPGDGLIGQAAATRRTIALSEVPADYLKVASAIGERAPLSVLVVPASADRLVNSVVELGFFRRLLPSDREFLEQACDQIGAVVRRAQYRARLEELLEETQRQAEELQSQQEELRVSNEELEEQSRALQESHVRLENQQSELEQINAQLEEQAQLVESQKDELARSQAVLSDKNADLERVNQYKSEFLANMSHELRTPLNSSLILAKLLSENKPGNLNADQVKFAETIYAAGNDLLTLINDVLDLSKIEAGKIELSVAPVEIEGLVRGVTQHFESLAREKDLRFAAEIDAQAAQSIETDRQRLEQILKNLLSNAIKFSDQGEVVLTVSPAQGGGVVFRVRDTGIGIAKHQQALIFDAFHQADSTTARKYGGTGLGLSISRDLAGLLGGELSVESELGKGSTFTLRLPPKAPASVVPPPHNGRARRSEPPAAPPALNPVAAVAPREPAPRRPPPPPEAHGDHALREPPPGRRILIIEDDARFADILCNLARELDFECLLADTAESGFALALREAPSAVVLDIRLPDHSGLSVLDRLKRNPTTRHIPVHVISAVDYVQSALSMGAVGYMLKPVQRDELTAALQRLADKAAQSVRRVLVVEDDAVQLDSVRKLLSADDVETAGASTAQDALEQLRSTTFDCMVLDLALPDSTGYELLEEMARENAYAFPPVIVYTGRSLTQDEEDRLRKYSRSIIIKGARSPERLLDEVSLFLHQVESKLPPERRRMLQDARDREALFEGRRILVVEDDVRNIFALSHVLEPKGAIVDIARNGREAIERLGKAPPIDLVLMDVMMPEMDGITATQEIRKNPRFSRLPIIALTAKAMPHDQERCLQAGANDYVAKPVDVDKLLSLIRVWIPK